MTIGTALVIIAALYLLDKYGMWKKMALISVAILAAAVVGFTGYYGWQKLHEHRMAKIDLSAGLVPRWDIPKDGISDPDVAYAILYPVKTQNFARTDAWAWYRDSHCVGTNIVNRIAHDHDLFSLDSYDQRWLRSTALPDKIKRTLWSAKVAECRLPAGSRNVKACLNREEGIVTLDKFADLGGSVVSCGRKEEIIYLNNSN